jgi:hypothetical protein
MPWKCVGCHSMLGQLVGRMCGHAMEVCWLSQHAWPVSWTDVRSCHRSVLVVTACLVSWLAVDVRSCHGSVLVVAACLACKLVTDVRSCHRNVLVACMVSWLVVDVRSCHRSVLIVTACLVS